jgi:uncharacterized membrane protein HdeD (DUF308 family)
MTSAARRIPFVVGSIAVGSIVFASVTAFARHRPRTFFYEVFEGIAPGYVDKFFGDKFFYAHLSFVNGIAAVFHGFVFAILALLGTLCVRSRSRRGALLILLLLVVVDVALLVFVFPDPNGERYRHWLYGYG